MLVQIRPRSAALSHGHAASRCLGKIYASVGENCTSCGQLLATLSRKLPPAIPASSAVLQGLRNNRRRVVEKLAAQIRPKVGRFGPNLGRRWPSLGPNWSKLAIMWPTSNDVGGFGSNSAKCGPPSANYGLTLADFGQPVAHVVPTGGLGGKRPEFTGGHAARGPGRTSGWRPRKC